MASLHKNPIRPFIESIIENNPISIKEKFGQIITNILIEHLESYRKIIGEKISESQINEIFQQHYPFELVQQKRYKNTDHVEHHYKFHTGKHEYHAYIQQLNSQPTISVSFGTLGPDATETNDAYRINHHRKHESQKIFSTIHHILKHHLQKYPDIGAIDLMATNDEPSRIKLYRAIAKKFTNTHDEIPNQDGVQLRIQTKDIKESLIEENLQEKINNNVRTMGRMKTIRIRIRNGKVQRNVKKSAIKGYRLIGGTVQRISSLEHRHRVMGQRRGKIKRRAHLRQTIRKRRMSLRKRHALGL